MQHQGKSTQSHHPNKEQEGMDWYELTHKNWRAWGSWFSWGSPTGLGLFFLSVAVTLWIMSQAFGWM